jgi:glycerophosphoryl diester phosphodiesterase
MIIAHRGASGIFPAHTRGSYEAAIEQGADVIECDLAVSKDRKFVCLHDEYLRNWLCKELIIIIIINYNL